MSISLGRALSLGVCLMVLAGTAQAQAQESIGNVDLVEVWAYSTPPGGARDSIFRGHQVFTDETIETVSSAYVHMTFLDGTTLAIGESTVLVLDSFVYDPNASDSLVADFTGGLYHLISGDIESETVLIRTPGLAIGLRGTDIVVQVAEDGKTDLAVLDGIATATPTAGGETVDVNAGQTATGSPGNPTVILTNGLPAFATTDLPRGTRGTRNLGGGTGEGREGVGGDGDSGDSSSGGSSSGGATSGGT